MSFYKQQREQIKRTILDTAVQLFRKNGYEITTIEEITKTVGIAKGTFYNFYGSKREILIQWAAQIFQAVDFMKALNKERTIKENLDTLVDLLVRNIASEEILFKNFLKEVITTYDENVNDNQFDINKIFTAIIYNSKDVERVETENREVKINVLSDALFMGMIHWFNQGKTVTGLGDYMKTIAGICLFGMLDREKM